MKLTKELNDRELRVREIQTRKEIEEPFLKPINASIDGKKGDKSTLYKEHLAQLVN